MQRYFIKEKNNNYLVLNTNDIHHIKNVMRNKPGDLIECVYNEKLYICEIIDTSNSNVKIIKELNDYNELNIDITIAIGLVKEQKYDLILQKLTELGVSRIIPLKMERSIIKIDNKKLANKLERWNKICKEASEQSKRNRIPEILQPLSLKELTNYNFDKKYICSLNTEIKLNNKELEQIKDNKTIFIIGPEGGISDNEEKYLESIGYKSISLGNRVMRVETAAIYIASIINFFNMR